MIMAGSISVFASSNVVTQQETSNISSTANDATITNEEIQRKAGDTSFIIKEVSRQDKDMFFVGYLKEWPDWAYTSSYTLNAGTTFSVSCNYNYAGIGTTVNFTKPNKGSRTIPADASKLSRLGAYEDVTFVKKEKRKYVGGVYLSSTYYVDTIVHNSYIIPVYK